MKGSLEEFKKYMLDSDIEKLYTVDTIPDFLNKILSLYKDNSAIITETENITYQKLYDSLEKICTTLVNYNIPLKTNIGIIGRNNYNFVKSSLGVMAYGSIAAVLPLQLPDVAIIGLIKKYNLVSLIYDDYIDEKIFKVKEACPNTIFIKFSEIQSNTNTKFNKSITPSDYACIVPTGGTTGKSKGALLSHKALLTGTYNGILGWQDAFNQTYYSLMPLSHVFGFIRNLMTCLYSGSKIYFCENMANIAKDLQTIQPTILVVVPALAEMLLNLVKKFGLQFLGGKLKTIICGAATVSPYLVDSFQELGINFCPGYGLTESANLVTGNVNAKNKPNSIGILFPNQEAKIVDGELWLKGDNIMAKYYNEEAENLLSFENGWFKTGDLIDIDNDNFFYFVGRKKDVIVLSIGENISPAHIESQLNNIPIVQDSLVYLNKNQFGMELLVSELLLRQTAIQQLNITNVEDYLQNEIDKINNSNMPYEKISKFIVRKEDFKRSPSMKVLRNQGV